MDHHELARLNSNGVEWDWSELHSRCLREARRVGLRGEDAEDAAQEGVMRAWRCRAQCTRPDRPEPWAAMIGRREALRLLAADRKENGLSEEHAAALPDALEGLRLRELLRSLPTQDRLLLVLRYQADLTQAEVAELLDTPAGTVAVRLHRARHRLRRALEA